MAGKAIGKERQYAERLCEGSAFQSTLFTGAPRMNGANDFFDFKTSIDVEKIEETD